MAGVARGPSRMTPNCDFHETWCILWRNHLLLPSGKHTKNYGKSQFLMGKLTISMAIFNSYVKLPEGSINQKTLLKSFCLNVHSRKMSIGSRCTVYICWYTLQSLCDFSIFFLPHDP